MPDHLQNNAPVGILLLFIYTPHLPPFSQAPVPRSVASRSGPEYILLFIKEVVLLLSSSILFQRYISYYIHNDRPAPSYLSRPYGYRKSS
jgi:hypothetical protein